MDPVTLSAISLGITTLMKVYASHTNKPPGWVPSEADWAEIEALSGKTAADYKREAVAAK